MSPKNAMSLSLAASLVALWLSAVALGAGSRELSPKKLFRKPAQSRNCIESLSPADLSAIASLQASFEKIASLKQAATISEYERQAQALVAKNGGLRDEAVLGF